MSYSSYDYRGELASFFLYNIISENIDATESIKFDLFKDGLDDKVIKVDDIVSAFEKSIKGFVVKANIKRGWESFGRMLMTLGLKYRIEGNNKAAIECWNRIFYHEIDFRRHEICSIIENTWRFYALVQETEGHLKEAIEAWKHHITLIELSMAEIYRDQMQDASYNISLCYYYTGCYAEAEYFLGKMMALINRTDLIRTNNALNLKAYLCSKKGKYDDAIKYHRDVLENIEDQDNINKPLSDYVNASIACNYADNNNPETALITIKNVTTNTADPYILDMYGYVYYKLKHYDEAIKYFDRALEAVNDDRLKSEIFFHKGNTLLQQEKYSDSRILYDSSSTINPSKSKVYNNKAVAYAYEKDLDNALEQLKKALTEEPSSTTVIENLAKSYSSGSTNRTFWDYWMSSKSKKIISMGIIILIVGILSVNIFIPALLGAIEKPIDKTTTKAAENSNLTATQAFIQNLKNNTIIGTNNLVLIGILVIILLSPVISSAKLGTTSLELTMIEIKGSDIVLIPYE